MAGNKQDERRIRELADKIYEGVDNEEHRERLQSLVAKRSGIKAAGKPAKAYDSTDAALARQAKEIRKAEKLKAQKDIEKAYDTAMRDLLGAAANVQWIALEKALGQARLADGSFDPENVSKSDLSLALKAAWEIANRVKGKTTTKMEGSVTHTFLQGLAETGELD